jgi:hypothetical protein
MSRLDARLRALERQSPEPSWRDVEGLSGLLDFAKTHIKPWDMPDLDDPDSVQTSFSRLLKEAKARRDAQAQR